MQQFFNITKPWYIRTGYTFFKKLLPVSLQNLFLNRNGKEHTLPLGSIKWGSFDRIKPLRQNFGLDDGTPVDRYYIESFLKLNASDIKGRVLEIGDNFYTCKYGDNKVTKSDILHVSDGNPLATFVGDLTKADHIPSGIFDCIILTQTLHLIYDVRAAIVTLYRILKPGGILLVTVPGISQIDEREWGHTWYWSFTEFSIKRLFEEVFHSENLSVTVYGNVLAAVAFLQGLVKEELEKDKLDYKDPYYPVTIAARVVKPYS